MKTILVAVDGSEIADRALKLAVDLARPLDARVRLIHVVSWWSPSVPPELADQLETGARKLGELLLQEASRVPGEAHVAYEATLSSGIPAEEIAKAADAPDVWLVVVGSHGKGAVERILVGSVSNRLLHVAHKPILVVR